MPARLDGDSPDTELRLLTRAEAHAVRRSARLTHAKLVKHLEYPGASPQRVSDSDTGATATDELVGIVVRAGRMGFCPARVATALGISADELASIQPAIVESAPLTDIAERAAQRR